MIWGCFDCIWVWEIGRNLQCARARARALQILAEFPDPDAIKTTILAEFPDPDAIKATPWAWELARARTADFGLPGPGSCFDCVWVLCADSTVRDCRRQPPHSTPGRVSRHGKACARPTDCAREGDPVRSFSQEVQGQLHVCVLQEVLSGWSSHVFEQLGHGCSLDTCSMFISSDHVMISMGGSEQCCDLPICRPSSLLRLTRRRHFLPSTFAAHAVT